MSLSYPVESIWCRNTEEEGIELRKSPPAACILQAGMADTRRELVP